MNWVVVSNSPSVTEMVISSETVSDESIGVKVMLYSSVSENEYEKLSVAIVMLASVKVSSTSLTETVRV